MSMNNNSSEIVADVKLQKFVITKPHEMLINELQHYDVTTITMHIFLKKYLHRIRIRARPLPFYEGSGLATRD